jgi:hypothetical protein
MAIVSRPTASPESPRNLKIAFLLRERDNYFTDEEDYSYGYFLNSGLYNSARMVCDMLHDRLGFDTDLAQLANNNLIDHYVYENRPDIVVIEAYWVTPAKLRELVPLHPNVLWVVRNHSSFPFLALEGVVMDWSLEYIDIPNVVLSNNDLRTNHHMAQLVRIAHPDFSFGDINSSCVLLPNYYPPDLRQEVDPPFAGNTVNIGLFGAIRPLKNHLNQAVAAIEYCWRRGLNLNFHINATRVEQGGSPILRNLRALFDHMPEQFRLVEHPWLEREDFLELVDQMDVGMQVSFAETYNITAADFVTASKPMVVSPEITWVHPKYYADPTDTTSIRNGLKRAMMARNHVNLKRLREYSLWSAGQWNAFLHSPAVTGEGWNPTPGRDDLYIVKRLPDYLPIPEPDDPEDKILY